MLSCLLRVLPLSLSKHRWGSRRQTLGACLQMVMTRKAPGASHPRPGSGRMQQVGWGVGTWLRPAMQISGGSLGALLGSGEGEPWRGRARHPPQTAYSPEAGSVRRRGPGPWLWGNWWISTLSLPACIRGSHPGQGCPACLQVPGSFRHPCPSGYLQVGRR